LNIPNYDKFPFIEAGKDQEACIVGWEGIVAALKDKIAGKRKTVIVVECYPGVNEAEVLSSLKGLSALPTIRASAAYKEERCIREMVAPDVTDDRVFGYLTRLDMKDYFDVKKLQDLRAQVEAVIEGVVLIVGAGASMVAIGADSE
jgi:hypothetical protein